MATERVSAAWRFVWPDGAHKPGCAPAMPDEAELKAFLDTHSGPTQG